jgi:hypothetical protein
MPVTVIGYQLECCYNSSPKLPGVYTHTPVRASMYTLYKLTINCYCYLMIKNTLRADATMKLTLETTMMSGIQLILMPS